MLHNGKNWVLLMVLLIAFLGGLVAAGWYVIGYELNSNNARWCATLELLTAQPVAKPSDPGANPSRESSYKLYLDFVELRHDFRCGD